MNFDTFAWGFGVGIVCCALVSWATIIVLDEEAKKKRREQNAGARMMIDRYKKLGARYNKKGRELDYGFD